MARQQSAVLHRKVQNQKNILFEKIQSQNPKQESSSNKKQIQKFLFWRQRKKWQKSKILFLQLSNSRSVGGNMLECRALQRNILAKKSRGDGRGG